MTNPYRTQIELDFCERVLGWSQEQTILDAPCGAGRHSLELAGMGYRVIGLDFSDYLLQQAQNRWKVTRVSPEYPAFVQGNLLTLPFQPNSFDHIICLFTSFGYGDNLEENLQVLRNFIGYSNQAESTNRCHEPALYRSLLNRVYQSFRMDYGFERNEPLPIMADGCTTSLPCGIRKIISASTCTILDVQRLGTLGWRTRWV